MTSQSAKHKFKRVIVTGGLGFIGSALCRRLLSGGVKVLVLDNFMFGRRVRALPSHPLLRIKKVDIRDRSKVFRSFKLFRPDAVFHLAAIAFIPKCTEDPGTALGVHLDGTLNIVAAAEFVRVSHFHFASSAAVYSPESVTLSEKKTPAMPPPDVYSVTKLAGELICERMHRETGMHVVITRAFNVYGPYHTNRFLIPSICEQIREGATTLRLGNLSVARDYVHVDDAVEAILLLMRHTEGLIVANIGSGKKTTVRELVAQCADIAKRKIRVMSDAKFRRSRIIDRLAWRADLQHITHLVGWRPKRKLKEGLEELILGHSI